MWRQLLIMWSSLGLVGVVSLVGLGDMVSEKGLGIAVSTEQHCTHEASDSVVTCLSSSSFTG